MDNTETQAELGTRQKMKPYKTKKNTSQHEKNPEKMSNTDPTEKPRMNPYVREG